MRAPSDTYPDRWECQPERRSPLLFRGLLAREVRCLITSLGTRTVFTGDTLGETTMSEKASERTEPDVDAETMSSNDDPRRLREQPRPWR